MRYQPITPPSTAPPIGTVVELIKSGDPRGWPTLCARLRPIIRWVTDQQFRLGHHDRNDIEQIVWLRTVVWIDRLDNPEALPGWIRTVAVRACCDLVGARSAHDQSLDASGTDIVDFRSDPHDLVVRAEQRAIVRQAVRQLPDARRRLMEELLDPGEPSYAAVADRLGEPLGSIGPHRIHALKLLRRNARIRDTVD